MKIKHILYVAVVVFVLIMMRGHRLGAMERMDVAPMKPQEIAMRVLIRGGYLDPARNSDASSDDQRYYYALAKAYIQTVLDRQSQ